MEPISPEKALHLAIREAGSQSELARRLNVRQQSVHEWTRTGRVPAARVLDVERAVEGKVTRHQLRPDIYPPEERRPFGAGGSDSQDADSTAAPELASASG